MLEAAVLNFQIVQREKKTLPKANDELPSDGLAG
jgi:hypothetical protein